MTPSRDRALVYIRKSVVRSGADTVSPERQRQACLEEARRHGWVVGDAEVYADAVGHQSGRTEDRPDWQRLRRRIRRDDTVAAVIVESLSRASRSVRDFFVFVEELRARGIALVSVKERFDTSGAIGQALLGMIAIINQLESDLASERMEGQIAFKKSQGRHWGLTPFGCRREEVTGALAPSVETYRLNGSDRTYYDALVRAYELYAEGELGYLRLSRVLNAEGWRFRSRRGEPARWDRHNVRSVLMMHRVYAGWVPVSGHNKERPAEWVRANYEPVLPVELCERVRDVVATRTRDWRPAGRPGEVRPYVHDYILTGILHCADCGRRLKGYRSASGRRYRHATRGACPQSWSQAEALEGQALGLLEALVLPEELTEDLVDVLLEAWGPNREEEEHEEWEELQRSIVRVRQELSQLVDIAVQTQLNAEVYREAIQERNTDLELLLARRSELERRTRVERATLDAVIERIRHVHTAAREATPQVQKELLRSVFERLEARRDEIVAWTPQAWCRPFF